MAPGHARDPCPAVHCRQTTQTVPRAAHIPCVHTRCHQREPGVRGNTEGSVPRPSLGTVTRTRLSHTAKLRPPLNTAGSRGHGHPHFLQDGGAQPKPGPQLPSELPRGQSFMPHLDPQSPLPPSRATVAAVRGRPPLHKAGVRVLALYSRKSHVTYSQPSPPMAPYTRVPHPSVQPTREPEVLQCLPLRNSRV